MTMFIGLYSMIVYDTATIIMDENKQIEFTVAIELAAKDLVKAVPELDDLETLDQLIVRAIDLKHIFGGIQ